MKRTKILSRLFAVLALTLSHLMCVVVTYNWCNLQWGFALLATVLPRGLLFSW